MAQQQAVPINVFAIVGKGDTLLYEIDLAAASGRRYEAPHLGQFILHTALDMVDEVVWNGASGSNMYLRQVDKFQDMAVSAFVTAGHIRLLLLSSANARNEDSIGAFFREVHELYIKNLLNPFYEVNGPITSATFDLRVRQAARKYLGV
eukprot:GDKI01048514.1.p1 GENE.GDKI01048514.1~~GDKI01048514.1.p1  ORF type:complete len:149 (+),score=18.50 GDKI01048514.1:44-490(+)